MMQTTAELSLNVVTQSSGGSETTVSNTYKFLSENGEYDYIKDGGGTVQEYSRDAKTVRDLGVLIAEFSRGLVSVEIKNGTMDLNYDL